MGIHSVGHDQCEILKMCSEWFLYHIYSRASSWNRNPVPPVIPAAFIYTDCVLVIDRVTWKTSVLTASLVLCQELNSSITEDLHDCCTALQNSAEAAACSHPVDTTRSPGSRNSTSWLTVIICIYTVYIMSVISLLMSHCTYNWIQC